MAELEIARIDYLDRVRGGWLGISIGGTLGVPGDGVPDLGAITFYDPMPGQPRATEHLDVQLIWMHALRQYGADPTSDDLAREWHDHLAYRWDELGCASRNLRRGLRPPITGHFDNWFREGVGAAARTGIWAMIAPGAPQVAASYAWRDAVLDHSQEGVWGAMFWAAVQSAAFFVAEPLELLEIGLRMLPSTCRVARGIRIVRLASLEGASALEARGRLIQAVGCDRTGDVALNIGYTVLGLLYGAGDFGSSLCTAVNCGSARSANGVMLGGLLGILHGSAGIPARWVDPVGAGIVMGWGLQELAVEQSVDELTDATLEMCGRAQAIGRGRTLVVEALSAPSTVPTLSAPLEPSPAQDPVLDGACPAPPVLWEPPAAPCPDLAAAAGSQVVSGTDAAPQLARDGAGGPEAVAAEVTVVAPAGGLVEPATVGAAPYTGVESSGRNPEGATNAAGTVSSEPEDGAAPADTPAPAAPPALPEPPPVDWLDNREVKPLIVASSTETVFHSGQFEVTVDYGEAGPAIAPGGARNITARVRNLAASNFVGRVLLEAPKGWEVRVPGAQAQRQVLVGGRSAVFGFAIRVPEAVALDARATARLVIAPDSAAPLSCDIPFVCASCWWMVGPLRNIGGEGFTRGAEPEDKPDLASSYLGRTGGLIRWERRTFCESVMDLEPAFTGQPGVIYLQTILHAVSPTPVRLLVPCSDGVRVWLNGQSVFLKHDHAPFRPLAAEGQGPEVVLRAGDNRVMLKIVRCDQPIRFAFTVVDLEGNAVLEPGNSRW